MEIEDITFHDNTIHSIEFMDEDYQTDLVLDIDHITEWLEDKGKYKFKVSPAFLTFNNVRDLKININKPDLTQHCYLESILDIKAQHIEKDKIQFTIILTSDSYIEFIASGRTLDVSNTEITNETQYLTKEERKHA